MDTGKLLKIIADIQAEEDSGNIQTRLQNIATYLDQNDPAALNNEKDEIGRAVTSSRLSEYAMSDYHALEQISAETFFGPGLYQNLQKILSSQSHEVRAKLDELIAARSEKLSALTQSQTSLVTLSFQSRALDDHNYEIGFVLPESYADMQQTEKAIHDFRMFLDALAHATGHPQPLKIKYVSNGTIELFVEAGVELAQNFGLVIDYALKIYGAIKAYAEIRETIQKRFSNKKRKDSVDELSEAEKTESVESLVNELIEKLQLPSEDDKNRVKKLFLEVLKHVENGVGAEVHTPVIQVPSEPAKDATEDIKKSYQDALKLYETKKAIDKNNQQIFIMQQNNFYGMDTKFLRPANNQKKKK